MRSELKTFGVDFLREGDGIRFLICERVERHLNDKTRRVDKQWRDDPRLFVLEVEEQMKALDGTFAEYIIESDAVGIMTRRKEYGPGKVILCSPSLNCFLKNLHADPWDKKRSTYRGVSYNKHKNRWMAKLMFEYEEWFGEWCPTMVDAWAERLIRQIQIVDLCMERLENTPRKFCAKPELMRACLEFEKIRLLSLYRNRSLHPV